MKLLKIFRGTFIDASELNRTLFLDISDDVSKSITGHADAFQLDKYFKYFRRRF